MSEKHAQWIFILLNAMAVFAVAYVVYDIQFVFASLALNASSIAFDSGVYYASLISVVWVMSAVQYIGLRPKLAHLMKYASALMIAWFIAALVFSNFMPWYMENKLESAGYRPCADPKEISRTAKGRSLIYVLGDCPSLKT